MASASLTIPYCGTAPIPDEIWTHWNLDPVLMLALGAFAFVYALAARRTRGGCQPLARCAFWASLASVVIALLSPLCSLSVALFSARVGQHMLLLLVAAPLAVLGLRSVSLPVPAWARGSVRVIGSVPVAWTAFAVFLWLWHTPFAYASTFASVSAYWAMHLTLFGSSVLLWRVLLPNRAEIGALTRFLAGFTTLLHMGLLGALITFAPAVLYSPQLLTTQVWGLTPLEDQQLGGLIMWVPGASAFMAAGLASVAMLLRPRAPLARGRWD